VVLLFHTFARKIFFPLRQPINKPKKTPPKKKKKIINPTQNPQPEARKEREETNLHTQIKYSTTTACLLPAVCALYCTVFKTLP
jgi:hypothetical protein